MCFDYIFDVVINKVYSGFSKSSHILDDGMIKLSTKDELTNCICNTGTLKIWWHDRITLGLNMKKNTEKYYTVT